MIDRCVETRYHNYYVLYVILYLEASFLYEFGPGLDNELPADTTYTSSEEITIETGLLHFYGEAFQNFSVSRPYKAAYAYALSRLSRQNISHASFCILHLFQIVTASTGKGVYGAVIGRLCVASYSIGRSAIKARFVRPLLRPIMQHQMIM